MTIHKLFIFPFTAAVLLTTPGNAQEPATQIIFAVPVGTTVVSGFGDDIGIFTGRPVGAMADTGDCSYGNSGGSHPIQNIIFVHPHGGGASTFATVILIESLEGAMSEPMPPGTRMIRFDSTGECVVASGARYNKFRGYLQ